MKGFFVLLVISLSVASANSLLTKEEFDNIKANASFETMEWEEYLVAFKDSDHVGMGIPFSQMVEQTKSFLQSYKEQMKNEEYPEAIKENEEEKRRFLEQIPREFDWRTASPKCFNNTPIKDQKFCGSCYAFAATFVASKRFCINSRNRGQYDNINLSPQDMVECDYRESGCHGGIIPYTWLWLENEGACTEECKPYTSGQGQVGYCYRSCRPNYRLPYQKHRMVRASLQSYESPEQIKWALWKYGPLMTGMNAFPDLATYKYGIYTHTYVRGEKAPEGHAVSLVGWGYDATYGEYWIVANSWGTQHGQNGYFKIPFGHCEITTHIAAMASHPEIN